MDAVRFPIATIARAIAIVSLAAATAIPHARAQDLEPRAYATLPVDLNFAAIGYVFSHGDVSTDPSVPLEDARLDIDAAFLAYSRSFGILDRVAKFDAVLPYAWVSGSADVNGAPVHRQVDGVGDPSVRLAYNFYGSPALSMEDFQTFEEDFVAGASVRLWVPLGQYQSGKLVNIGTRRWAVKPEIGLVKAWGPFKLEVASAVTVFSTNPDFLGGHHRDEDPLFAQQVHLVLRVWRGTFVTADGTYYSGGRTTLDGVGKDDEIANGRVGGTLSAPLSPALSVKLYGSTGVWTRTGTDFDTYGVGLVYRWSDGG